MYDANFLFMVENENKLIRFAGLYWQTFFLNSINYPKFACGLDYIVVPFW